MVVGWREWVLVPQLGLDQLKAKVDTGGLFPALHALNLEFFAREGGL